MLKNKIKINMVMSVVLLVSMTIIACNMDKVATVEMEKENKVLPIYVVDNLDDAIKTARKYAKPSQIVLFSPASASFDMFKNAVQRGELFKEKVNLL